MNANGPGGNGDKEMDQRLRGVEGEVGTLKDWRSRTVDPWITERKAFHVTVEKFITKLESREEVIDKLSDERHQNNSFKLNFILVVATIGLLLVGILSFWIAFQSAKHSLLNPLILHGYSPIYADTQTSTIPPLAR